MKLKLMTLAFGFCLVVGLPLAAMAGPTPGGTDTDGDGVEDSFDNCTARVNPGQGDTDHDGCGDFCDFDFNNDGLIKGGEVAKAASQAGVCPAPPASCDCDFNHDGVCKGGEVALISTFAGFKPGPSGLPWRNLALCGPPGSKP
jgi:hypothetical protein